MKKRSIVAKKSLISLFVLIFLLAAGLAGYSQSTPQAGDANGDGSITIIDAMVTAQYCAGMKPANFSATAADVNGSTTVEITDALLIARYCAGIITSFPVSNNAVQVVQSSLARNLSPQLASGELNSVVTGNNQLAFDFYKQLSSDSNNIFFSPVSITFAFAMSYAGANGNTETEMARTLHFTLAEDRLHNALNALELTLTTPAANPSSSSGEDLKLKIANSSWGERDYTFVPQYLDTLATYYGAGMNLVSFKTQPEASRLLINDWIAVKTEQRIKDLLPQGSISNTTRLVLTNAIYFKANWLYPFYVENTTTGPFTMLDGSTVNASLMHKTVSAAYYQVANQYQAISLQYQGTKKNAMLIILPAAGQFQEFENNLTLDTFNTIKSGLRGYDVTLTMPKYTYEWSGSLTKPLQALGMKDAFAPNIADFSGINGGHDMFISDVLHKSFVAVDEKGTEASAATAIVIGITSVPPTATMTINRPFLFFIYNQDTGAILFCGRVLKP